MSAQDRPSPIHQDEFASSVAGEIERLLVRRGGAVNIPSLISASRIAGSVAAAITSLSPTDQRAINTTQSELAGLASKIVQALPANN